ncbi:hypothetical protein KAH94_04645 [bacterium]|nr:hypothetical protein [bacterium]
MKNYWFIADTHFNHENFLTFKNFDGSKVRDFKSVEEMNEKIIENWNKCVKPQDNIYHLGDVISGDMKNCDKILNRLNGKKRLILGNHDVGKLKYLQPYFKKIDGVRDLNIKGFKCILSHIPLHPNCIKRFGVNIHGHLHNNRIWRKCIGGEVQNDNYFNVSVERTNYKPINLEEIKQCLK